MSKPFIKYTHLLLFDTLIKPVESEKAYSEDDSSRYWYLYMYKYRQYTVLIQFFDDSSVAAINVSSRRGINSIDRFRELFENTDGDNFYSGKLRWIGDVNADTEKAIKDLSHKLLKNILK